MTLSPRKRPSHDDSEFMPVTKRLNLLSIDANSRESTSDSSTNTRDEEGERNSFEVARILNEQHQHHQQHQQHLPTLAQQLYLSELYQNYNPSLSCSQNPIYYEANRVLFEAHQQRIIRMQSVKARA